MSDPDSAFAVAKESNERVNEMLAETDGAVCTMGFDGAIGYHINVATGETDPEYLWKVALLQALDESVFEMIFVGAENPEDARSEMQSYLQEWFSVSVADTVADRFETKLTDLIDVQEDRAGGPEQAEVDR